jgi:signal transduction histidine kinase/CheY-like chemotaxis protein
MQKLLNRKTRLGVRWKLLFPFVIVIALMLVVILPLTNTLIAQRLEAETDSRLSQTAVAIGELLEAAEEEVLVTVSLLANLPEVEALASDSAAIEAALAPHKEELGLAELSYYAVDGTPLYYGGTLSQDALNSGLVEVRDRLILRATQGAEAMSGIAIAVQSSQIIAVAPIISTDGEMQGTLVAVTSLDAEFIYNIAEILNVDIAIVRNQTPIELTIDPTSGYELLLQEGLIPRNGSINAVNLVYQSDGVSRRLLVHPLRLGGLQQGYILVAQPLNDLFAVQERIQQAIFGFVGVIVVVMILFSLEVVINVANPLNRLAEATSKVSAGQFQERVPVPNSWIDDEVVDISRTFNIMTERINDLYTGLEQKVTDRTAELREASEELAIKRDEALEASRSKSLFLANMSHELRTPLNAIIGYSEMLEEEAEDSGYDDIVPDLQKIQKAGTHLLTLINDILDISKIEAGKVELFLEDFSLAELIDEIIDTIHPLIERNTNTLVFLPEGELGILHSDITKLRQMIFNLLSNAAKFTEKGVITLLVSRKLEEEKEWLYVEVRDTGIGMTAEQLGRVFQEFSQADSSTTRKYGGTGLGLPISRHFAQVMGGDIIVKSETGKGSSFTIRVPVFVQAKIATGEIAAVTGPIPHLPDSVVGLTVLVIDDDLDVHELLNRQLTREGFHVISATSGEDGLKKARDFQPTIIALDVLMPSMDGWTVLQSLKTDAVLSHIPVVMLSIMNDKSLAFAMGANDYLTKPVDRNTLVSVLKRHLPAGDKNRSILIVEDDVDTQDLFLRAAQREGWTGRAAENGRIGLERIKEQIPELILLDLMMPEMDGFEFLTELRKVEAWRAIPVIVVTAKNLTDADLAQLSATAQRIVQKGNSTPTNLVAEIRRILQKEDED